MSLKLWKDCERCKGAGGYKIRRSFNPDDGDAWYDCPECEGKGTISLRDEVITQMYEEIQKLKAQVDEIDRRGGNVF